MSDVPLWIQTLQALATPVIGATVGVVAFMQWRTAHQKVILDLFDRRLAVVNEVNDTVTYALATNGNLVSVNAAMRLYECEAKSLFLFGSAIVSLIGQLRDDIFLFHRQKFDLELDNMSAQEGRELNEKCGATFQLIGKHQQEFIQTVLPFMRMHSRAVPTPVEWFNERNKIRLTYADEKQR